MWIGDIKQYVMFPSAACQVLDSIVQNVDRVPYNLHVCLAYIIRGIRRKLCVSVWLINGGNTLADRNLLLNPLHYQYLQEQTEHKGIFRVLIKLKFIYSLFTWLKKKKNGQNS